ncbi:MAG: hypothetical protein EZS28_037572, partial [Streblomastix strix]
MIKLKKLDLRILLAACQNVQRLWFEALQKLHDENKYPDEHVFNIDETSLRLNDQWTGRVIYPSDPTPGFKQTPQKRLNATLVLALAKDEFFFQT